LICDEGDSPSVRIVVASSRMVSKRGANPGQALFGGAGASGFSYESGRVFSKDFLATWNAA
jgi:hypothetical protein